MGQQGSRPDVNAVTELPSPHGGRRPDLEQLTEVDITTSPTLASSSSQGKPKHRRPSQERLERLPPATPGMPITGSRPTSQGGVNNLGVTGISRTRTPQGLLLNKPSGLRQTANAGLGVDESPPPTRPGTAASLLSVNAARHTPQRLRADLPGQMPDIRSDPSPPPSQPASLALRSRPGTSQNSQLLSTFPASKALARPSSSGNESPAVQPLPLAVTLKGPGTMAKRNVTGRSTEALGRAPSEAVEKELPKAAARPLGSLSSVDAGRRGIRWVEDVARHYRIGSNVMPSCHAGMEIRHASRATGDQDPPTGNESFVVKLRYKNKSFQGKNEEGRWRTNTELILNMPQANGIARLIDVLEDTKAYYVIMERAGGCDLYECLSGAPDRRLPPNEAREVLRELLAAVAELHSHGFIHKDLKLENVMLNRPGPKCPAHIRRNLATSPGAGVKLIDFDAVEEWNSTNQKSRHVLGTDQYIAPEAYEGKYSPASDIFAVGVIAYKMLTGSFPYNGRLFDDKPGENWVGSPKMKEIKQKLCDARVNWTHPVFEKEPGASRLVSRMLAVEESERPDAPECLRDPWLSDPIKESSQPVARAVLVQPIRGRAQPVHGQRGMAHSAAIGNVQNLLAGRSVESSQGRRKRLPDEMPGNWATTLH